MRRLLWWCLVLTVVVVAIRAVGLLHVGLIAGAVLLALAVWLFTGHDDGASWRRNVNDTWPDVARAAGLGHTVSARLAHGDEVGKDRVVAVPELVDVSGDRDSFTVSVRTAPGQTTDDLVRHAPALRDTYGMERATARRVCAATVTYTLTNHDALTAPVRPAISREPVTSAVGVGIGEDGERWTLQMQGLHTLIVGCSGAGKGSVFWGIACGLSAAIDIGHTRLFGIDLKMGMEVGVGEALFSEIATDEAEAVTLLEHLDEQMRARGRRMRGIARSHEPTEDDPLIVLMIDELVAITSYVSDPKLKKRAAELLSRILTQGRAVGFVVVGCLQDPRKEALPMRNLFTQTIALRLRSREEVAMVLGAGLTDIAPADKIGPHEQGVGYVVGEDGSVRRVRAAFWPDELIQKVADRFGPGSNATPDQSYEYQPSSEAKGA